MPISVTCPECGKKYRMPDRMAGDAVPCKECGADIDVVEGGGRARSSRPRSKGKSRRKSGVSSGTVTLIVLGVAGLLVVGGGVWAAMSLLGRNRANQGQEGFAPGGVGAIAAPTVPPGAGPGAAGSRFDAPVTSGSGGVVSAGNQLVATGPRNPLAGIGFGNVVGIAEPANRPSNPRQAGAEFEILKEQPDSLPPEIWTLEPDPPKEPVVFQPDKKTVRVKVPVTGNRTTAGSIVFPVVPSPFVAVGANAKKGDVREIWDLGSGKKVSKISDLNVETADVALSPDGRYFAGAMEAQTGGGSIIGVYDIEEHEVIGNFEMTDWARHLALAFPRPDLLLAMDTFGGRTIHAWEIPSGNKLYTIELGWDIWNKFPPVFSPGGKYLAWTFREWSAEMIAVYDLDDGRMVGSMTLPEYDIGWWLHLHGLAFSRDGSELAAIIDGWECSKVVIYSMKTGEIVDHMTFKQKLQQVVTGEDSPWNSYNPLVYFPGNQRLLAFEHGVIDRSVGELVWGVPRSGVNFPGKRWPMDESHLTVIDVAGNSASVLVYELPEEKITKAAQKIADRMKKSKDDVPTTLGRVDDTALVDVSGGKHVVPQTTDWRLQPDARLAPGEAAPRPLPLRRATGSVHEFAVSAGKAPVAAVMRGSGWTPGSRIPKGNQPPQTFQFIRSSGVKEEKPFADQNRHASGFGSGKSRCWLDLYDLASGRISRQIRMAYDADLAGISPDGSRVLLWAALKPDRLDVYDTASGELVVSWQPQLHGWISSAFLTGARMLDSERVYTLSSEGQLDLWRITGGEQPAAVKVLSAVNVTQPAISPAGRQLGYSDGQAYHLIDVASGESLGRIPDVGEVHGAAFHPGGGKLALLSEYKGGYYLFTADLRNGQVSPPFPVPVLSPFLEWHGDRYVLLDHRKLVDVEQKVVAWTYELPEGAHLPSTPDGRHWYLAGVNDPARTPILASAELPTSDAAAKLNGAALQPEFLLQPGGKCSLTIQLSSGGGAAEEARKHVTAELAKHKISVEPGQPVALVLSVGETIGETSQKEFTSFGFGPSQTVSLTQKTAQCKVSFQAGGETAWETSRPVGNSVWSVTTKGKQSIPEAVEEQYQDSIKYFFTSVQLPPFVFTPKAANGLGTTTLSSAR